MDWLQLRHDNLLQTVMEGRLEGKRARGKKRIMVMDDIRNGKTCDELKRAEDRELWRSDVMRDLP